MVVVMMMMILQLGVKFVNFFYQEYHLETQPKRLSFESLVIVRIGGWFLYIYTKTKKLSFVKESLQVVFELLSRNTNQY